MPSRISRHLWCFVAVQRLFCISLAVFLDFACSEAPHPSRVMAIYKPPWKTKLDTTLHWETEDIYEKNVGDVVDRLVAVGRKERHRAKFLSKPARPFVATAWKHARRLGAEIIDLRGRFRKV